MVVTAQIEPGERTVPYAQNNVTQAHEEQPLLNIDADVQILKPKWSPPPGFLWIEIGKYFNT